MIARVGAISGTAVAPAPSVSSIIPPASAIRALISVSSMAETEPKTKRQDDHGHRDPDQLAHRSELLLGDVDHRAAHRDLEAITLRDAAAVSSLLRVLLLDLERGPVVLDSREGDPAVLGDLAAALPARGR